MRISEGRRCLQIISSVLVLTVFPICFARSAYQWKRLSQNPVVAPQGQSWESAGAFNPAIVQVGGRFRMLYRAQDAQGVSRLGYAESSDGMHFARRPEPVVAPETNYEKAGGVEDPRIVKISAQYWLTYTGYNRKDAQRCLAISNDLLH